MAKAKPITGLDPRAPTGKNARIIARVRLEEMYNWDRYVDNPYNIRELHDLRIAAKRLRYTLEIFEEVLPEASKSIVKELTQIQDELGALHDSDATTAGGRPVRPCVCSLCGGTLWAGADAVQARAMPRRAIQRFSPALVPTAGARLPS